MKRVLFVAFDFPPRRTSGVYRPTGLTKYLPGLGWQPTVLTIKGAPGDIEDLGLLARVPTDVPVVRTRYLPLAGWEKLIQRPRPSTSVATEPPTEPPRNESTPRGGRFLRAVVNSFRACLYFPDHTAGWIPFGLAKAIQLHRQRPFDLVVTTSPPRSGPVIGLLFKLLLKVQWVAEFRDPWLPPPEVRDLLGEPVPSWRRALDRRLYAQILSRADAVVTVTQGHADELRDRYKINADKLFVVNNGFDEDDFNHAGATDRGFFSPAYLQLSHFGTVYPQFSGRFFPALIELLQECPHFKERLRVNVIGFPDRDILQYANREELRDVLQIQRFIGHDDALRAMRSSNCLLVFWGHPYISKSYIPGKLYEYLRVGRPILAVTCEGGTKQLVEKGNAGWVVPPDDVEGIKEVMKTLLNEVPKNGFPKPAEPEFVAQFRYDRLAARLAGVFNGVLSNAR